MEAEPANSQAFGNRVVVSNRHRIGSIVFGLAVGLLVATLSYRWVTNPEKQQERRQQEHAVMMSRTILATRLQLTDPEIVDALAPNRKVGKVYIYPVDRGWELSGYYRRDDDDSWHPYLMAMSRENTLMQLKVKDTDAQLARIATADPLLIISN